MTQRDPLYVPLALAGACLVGLAVRVAGFASVFPGGGEVVLTVGDGLYHARSALYTLTHFPRILTFDAYLGFPDGSAVPVQATARAGTDGVARVRVPYATDRLTPTRSLAPYHARVGERSVRVHVPEEAVQSGATIRVPDGASEVAHPLAASAPGDELS